MTNMKNKFIPMTEISSLNKILFDTSKLSFEIYPPPCRQV